MSYVQADLFGENSASQRVITEDERIALRAKLEAKLAELEAAKVFPWKDGLEAAHEENRFERDARRLGDEGKPLWDRFDVAMDRLYDS